MPEHYYTKTPRSEHKPTAFDYEYRGQTIRLQTDSGVFSRTEVDYGTDVLLNALPQDMAGDVLDMGCGYGVIGVAIGKRYPSCHITMADVNERACELSRKNAAQNGVSATVLQSDGYVNVMDKRYAFILQNPPIRAGKTVIYRMFADAAKCLEQGGELWLVIRKQQGAPSAICYLQTLFETVETPEKKGGYWVLRCHTPIQQEEND